jgi:uncharacterized oligopeptide transporter (OPT) family protein
MAMPPRVMVLMVAPMTSSLAAYMLVTNTIVPGWQLVAWMVIVSIIGVLLAFPMKRRFNNYEQHPFPEGRACGVVLDALYEKSAAAAGMFKARALAMAAVLAGTFGLVSGENYMKLLQERWLGFQSSWHFPTHLDGWYYSLVDRGLAPLPKLAGVDIRQLGLSPTIDFAMIGAGGLMGIRTAASMLIGAVLNFVIVVPIMIAAGEITPRAGSIAEGTAIFGRAYILNSWALWWGICRRTFLSRKPYPMSESEQGARSGKASQFTGAPSQKRPQRSETSVSLWPTRTSPTT